MPSARVDGMHEMHSLHVLVVDDSSLTRTFVRGSLLRMGIRHVYEAADGSEALKCLTSNPNISVVILDWEMPVMDGIEFTRVLRQQEAYKDTYVLMLTSHAEQGHVAKALASGVNDYLVKPFNPTMMRQRFERVLSRPGYMHTTRFGDYLIARGLIDRKALDFATECQRALDISQVSIGTIAIMNGICDPLAVIEKLRPALRATPADRPLVSKLLEAQDFWTSLINTEQIEQIVRLRSSRRLLIGEVIAALGILSPEMIQQELDRFLAVEKPSEASSAPAPDPAP